MTILNKDHFLKRFRDNLIGLFGKTVETASKYEKYAALSNSIMYEVQKDWMETEKKDHGKRNAYYFSAEFLIGRSLGNNLLNLGFFDEIKEILLEEGIDFNELEDEEEDAALGNGGLGRLAACFMESAASEGKSLQGYGVRYSEGIFKQKFENGFQVEEGDNWTQKGDFWSIRKESESQIVTFRDWQVKAVPYDIPVVGYRNGVVNTLRLWQSEAIGGGFDFNKFNDFKYDESIAAKNRAEDITRVLYPNDIQRAGKVLRFIQQYFFVSASVQDMIKRYLEAYPEDGKFKNFTKYHVIQLNDTHPVIAIPEFMRLLIDDHNLSWDEAWDVVTDLFAYTNHTVLPEALERWSLDIVDEVAPRCKDIVIEIDRRMVEKFSKTMPQEEVNRYKIIENSSMNMAWLAIYVAKKVNGVAEIHTNILINDTLKDWYKIYPDKFVNKTNGVTPRRWLQYANPELTDFINKHLASEEWKHDLTKLKGLMKFIEDEEVLEELNQIKFKKKEELAKYILENEGVELDPHSIFDIQVKRLHEYKRQLLNALHIIYLYNELKENPDLDIVPRTFIFGAKAAPGYFRAKAIIKFINEIANLINNDESINGKIKVVFVQNFRVTYGEKIYPASDVSEQISTAGKEASGTGNMKFMMNGTVTLGTYDGANVEIFREAGLDNNYLFGASVEELEEIKDSYNPKEFYYTDQKLKACVDYLINESLISDGGNYMFLDIYKELVGEYGRGDTYYVLKDFASYRQAQEKIDRDFRDKKLWAKKCLANLANSGKFSSDRTILEYCEEIWEI